MFVAATTRTLTGMARSPPTRLIRFSWSARSTFAWAERLMSPISSRKSVPPSACSNFPIRCFVAPVKEPFSWPKSSLSMSSEGMAAQLTSTRGPGLAGRAVVDPLGDELLPRPRLARDEHAGLGRGHALDGVLDAADGGALAQDRRQLRIGPLGDGLLHPAVLRLELAAVHRVADGEEEAVEVGRLLDKVEGAELRRLHRRLDRAVAGDHDDGELGELLAQGLQHLHPVALGHLHVEEDEVVAALAGLLQRGLPVGGLLHVEVLVLEDLAERPADARLVVYDQDGGHKGVFRVWVFRVSCSSGRWRVTSMVIRPCPSTVSA